jgi:hypothetical protein
VALLGRQLEALMTVIPARMLIMVPSRERPQNVARFAQAAADTVTDSDVIFLLDDSDPLLNDSTAAAAPWRYTVSAGWPATVAKLNEVAMEHADLYPVLMFTGDDTIPRNSGWDRMLADAIDNLGGTGYAFPDAYPDGNTGSGCRERPEHVAISSDIVKTLGWFACPAVNHFTCDCVWADIGTAAGCLTFVPEAVVEHMHWSRNGRKDHVVQRAISNAAADYEGYAAWRAGQMDDDVAAVRKLRGTWPAGR